MKKKQAKNPRLTTRRTSGAMPSSSSVPAGRGYAGTIQPRSRRPSLTSCSSYPRPRRAAESLNATSATPGSGARGLTMSNAPVDVSMSASADDTRQQSPSTCW